MSGHHFISYSRVDAEAFAFRLYDALRSGTPPFVPWLDQRDLNLVMAHWDDYIVEAIRQCASLLFVVSADSVEPQSVSKAEYTRALRYKKPVIPILIDFTVEIPLLLDMGQHVDFTAGFEPALNTLRRYLAALDTPQGKLAQLKYRLQAAERDLRRARNAEERLRIENETAVRRAKNAEERSRIENEMAVLLARNAEQQLRIENEMAQLQKQIADLELAIRNPQAAAGRTEESIGRGIQREQRPEKRVARPAPTKFINPPPGVAPTYFQDRHVETKLIRDFLEDDARRLMTIAGRAGIGKTVLACRLLKALEGGQLPDDLGRFSVDAIVYLSALGSRTINVPNLYADLCKLLPPEQAEELGALYKDSRIGTQEKMRALLAAFPEGRTLLFLDNFEVLIDTETHEINNPDLFQALDTLLQAPPHAVKAILTTRIAPRDLALVQPARQMRLQLEEGLESPYAENILRELDADGTVGLKSAPDELLAEARKRTRGYPRALEALYAILSVDRHTSLEDILHDTRKLLPENVVEVLVGEAFSRLDQSAQMVMQALAVYARPVPAVAVDYLLQRFLPAVDSAPILNRLVNMQFVRKEGRRYYLHPVDCAYALGRVPEGKKTDRAVGGQPAFTQFALRHRGAEFFNKTRKPREDWKSIEDLAPQLAEFDLRYAAEDYETAADVLHAIDRHYLWMWGQGQLVVQKRESLVGRLGSPHGEFRNSFSLAWCYWSLGCFEESLAEWDRAIQLAKQNKDKLNIAVCQHNKALVRWDLGELHESLKLLETAASEIMQCPAKDRQAALRNDMGIVHLDLGRPREATRLYREAERLAGEARAEGAQGDVFRIHADALDNLALASLLTGDVEAARKWDDLALEIPVDQVGHFNTSYHLVTRARVLLVQSEYRAAVEDCKAAIDLGQPSLRYRAASYMAIAHALLGEPEMSLGHARQAVHWTRPLLARDRCSRDAPYFMGLAQLCAAQKQEALHAYQRGLTVCSAEGVVRNALLDLHLLERLPQPPEGTAQAVALLEASLPHSTSWPAAAD